MADLPTYDGSVKNGKYGMWPIMNPAIRLLIKLPDWQSAERYLDSFYSKNLLSRLKDDFDVFRLTLAKARSMAEDRDETEQRKLAFRRASKDAKNFRKKLSAGDFGSEEEKEREKIAVYSFYAQCMNELQSFFGKTDTLLCSPLTLIAFRL